MATKKVKTNKKESAPTKGDQLDEVMASIKAGLTMPQAAKVTGFHIETLRKWYRSGKLPVFRVGNVVRVNRDALAKFLKERADK